MPIPASSRFGSSRSSSLGVFTIWATLSLTCSLVTSAAFAQTQPRAEPKDLHIDREADGTERPDDITDEPPKLTPSKKASKNASKKAAGAKNTPTEHDAATENQAGAESLVFADHLFLDGDYYRAITEYRRFLFEVRGRGSEAPRAALAIGEALLRGEQWDAAGRQFDGVAQRTRNLGLRRTALFAAGRAYLLDGRPELAKPRFRLISTDEQTPAGLRRQSSWYLAWGHFDAGELTLAKETFQLLASSAGEHQASAEEILLAMQGIDHLPTKDPLTAGLLSLVPGLGHFYLGQWVTGTTSLVWNALFLFATIQAFLTGDIGIALVLTVFEIGWYGGGIFGAVAGANRYNRDAVRNWRDDILATHSMDRELPDAHLFRNRSDAPPGSLLRFGGRF
ncbi:MAG: hypothetical protein GY822_02290 [Deltaproteobacteria bacterium]|nr:hypothetical protein [Deltaproteobacteria bacterium]